MRCVQCGYSTSEVLQHVFPFLVQLNRSPLQGQKALRTTSRRGLQIRNYAYTSGARWTPPASYSSPQALRPLTVRGPPVSPRAYGPKDLDRSPRDEEIQSYTVQIVEEGGITDPQDLRSVLNSIDRKHNFLVQLRPAAGEDVPVCKVLPKEQVFKSENQKAKRVKTADDEKKQIELSWKMAEGDLSHKMNALAQFLEQGRKVEIVIVPKRKKDIISEADSEAFLAVLRKRLGDMLGAKETQPLSGTMGKMVTLYYEGPQQNKAKVKEKGLVKLAVLDLPWHFKDSELQATKRRIGYNLDKKRDVGLVVGPWKDRKKSRKEIMEDKKREVDLDPVIGLWKAQQKRKEEEVTSEQEASKSKEEEIEATLEKIRNEMMRIPGIQEIKPREGIPSLGFTFHFGRRFLA